jgi:hypothetical protein
MTVSLSTMQPVGTPMKRTYRAEGATTAIPLTRGYGVVKGTAEDQVKVPTGAGQRCIGVVEETVTTANAPVSIVMFGETIGISGQSTITPGMELLMDGDGKFTTAEGDAANERAGRSVSSAALEDDEFVIFVNPVKLWT